MTRKPKKRKPRPLEGKIVSPKSESLPEKLPHDDDRPRGVDFKLSFVGYPARMKTKRLQLAIEDLESKLYPEKNKKKRV